MSTNRIITTIAIVAIAAALIAPTASAWDSHRKGIVAGFGLGATPAAHLSRDYADYSVHRNRLLHAGSPRLRP